jgi:hypothetical protein
MFGLFRKICPAKKMDFTNSGFSIVCASHDYDKFDKYLIGSLRRQNHLHELFIIDNIKRALFFSSSDTERDGKERTTWLPHLSGQNLVNGDSELKK